MKLAFALFKHVLIQMTLSWHLHTDHFGETKETTHLGIQACAGGVQWTGGFTVWFKQL